MNSHRESCIVIKHDGKVVRYIQMSGDALRIVEATPEVFCAEWQEFEYREFNFEVPCQPLSLPNHSSLNFTQKRYAHPPQGDCPHESTLATSRRF